MITFKLDGACADAPARIQPSEECADMPINTLICTVGTSLFGNLQRLDPEAQSDPALSALGRAYRDKNWIAVAARLRDIDPRERVCGAEINSVASLDEKLKLDKLALHILHSDTEDGRNIAEVLRLYFQGSGWEEAQAHCIEGLRDDAPDVFRTQGLRNLTKIMSKLVRESGGMPQDSGAPSSCAINATGGYKAQIAIGVLMGQSLGIPVYYKHELFDAIIEFPPMPVALDYSLWQKASGMFMALDDGEILEWERIEDEDWDDRFEPLVERTAIDGKDHLALSPAGQIFHETFSSRFAVRRGRNGLNLPPESADKQPPALGEHSYRQARGPITAFMQKVTDQVPYVRRCSDLYWNPDLSKPILFRRSSHGVEGVYSNGTWCFKFMVETTAENDASYDEIVADLNAWLRESGAG